MSTDIQNLLIRHSTLLRQKHTETSHKSLIGEAERLIEELSEAELDTSDEDVRRRLSSYATYWRAFVFEETGVYPRIGSLTPFIKSSEEASPNLLVPTIGIITASPREYVAVRVMLEHPTEFLVSGMGASRRYLLGNIPAVSGGNHTVVLSLTDMGNSIAADRVALLLANFPEVNSVIMTGIASGIPNPGNPDEHVRLGDVVVSSQKGVVQIDFHREGAREFVYRNPPRPPSAMLLEAVSLLQAEGIQGKQSWLRYVERGAPLLDTTRPPEVSSQ